MSSPSYAPEHHSSPTPAVDDCGTDSHSASPQSPSCETDGSAGGSPGLDIPTLLGLVHGITGNVSVQTPLATADLNSSMQSTGGDSSVGLSVNVGTGSEHANLVDVDIGGQADGTASTIGTLLSAAILDGGGDCATGSGDSTAYDGNVGLTVDLGPALDSTLDLITTSSSLFDVPALDITIGDILDG